MNLFRPIVFFNPKQQTFSPVPRDATIFKTYRLKTLKIFYNYFKNFTKERETIYIFSLLMSLDF
jgi:hypothetical protein